MKNEIKEDKYYVGMDLTNKIVVHKAQCPFCEWQTMTYSKALAATALSEHCASDHRSDILQMIRDVDNIDQVLIDLLSDPPRKFSEQVFAKHISPCVLEKAAWVGMPDLLQIA